jgi:hypothetical protein
MKSMLIQINHYGWRHFLKACLLAFGQCSRLKRVGFSDNSPTGAAYDELFTRWLQFGTFCPMLRTHGNNDKETESKIVQRFPKNQRNKLKFNR